ncbi:MAG: hypothetical protein WAN93_00340, partial [Solirubrobacteraceae bacterium]
MSSRRSAARQQTIRRRRMVGLAVPFVLVVLVAIASGQDGDGSRAVLARHARQGVLAARADRSSKARGRSDARASRNLRRGSNPSVLPGPVLIADRDNNRLLEV